MEGEPCGETMAVEQIEWPFLKTQRQGGDPAVGGTGNDESENVAGGDHHEIVISNFSSDGNVVETGAGNDGGSGLETCLISSADLAALSNGPSVDNIKIETFRVDEEDAGVVSSIPSGYSFDSEIPSLSSAFVTDPNDDQKLIRVYQTAMEDNDNKLITVYEIKPDMDSEDSFSQHSARDVLVEIVPEEQLLSQMSDHQQRRVLTNEELQVQLGQSVPLPPDELAAVTNSTAHTVNPTGSLAELRCTLCGFVSYSRDEIASHCEQAHELFLCQACNLVFKKKASLQSHARAKHNNHNLASYHAGATPRPARTKPFASSPCLVPPVTTVKKLAPRKVSKPSISHVVLAPFPQPSHLASPTKRQRSVSKIVRTSMSSNSLELMPEINEILAKNKAVLPNLASAPSTFDGGSKLPKKKRYSVSATKVKNLAQEWMRKHGGRVSAIGCSSAAATTAMGSQQSLMLNTRLSDPQTRNHFNSEFAKKITSTGVGPELFGMDKERLPSLQGTYTLDIKERPAENGDVVTINGEIIRNLPTVQSDGEPATNGREMLYYYDILQTGAVTTPEQCCEVICGICNFSNARIENVLFHCEIDHKQYYCQNRRCQLGFSSWDSLMKHMKHSHKKVKA